MVSPLPNVIKPVLNYMMGSWALSHDLPKIMSNCKLSSTKNFSLNRVLPIYTLVKTYLSVMTVDLLARLTLYFTEPYFTLALGILSINLELIKFVEAPVSTKASTISLYTTALYVYTLSALYLLTHNCWLVCQD